MNRLMGINNWTQASDFGIQGRGPISEETYAALPRELLENGSLLMLGGEVQGFTAVYESATTNADGKNGSFLFWGVAMPEEDAKRIGSLASDELKHKAVLEYLANSPAAPDLLPKIVENGLTNLKNVNLYSSKEPGNWRAGRADTGRVILIGDAIHPMTRTPRSDSLYDLLTCLPLVQLDEARAPTRLCGMPVLFNCSSSSDWTPRARPTTRKCCP